MKLHDFPRYPLTFGPSPIHELDRLTKHLGGGTLWASQFTLAVRMSSGLSARWTSSMFFFTAHGITWSCVCPLLSNAPGLSP